MRAGPPTVVEIVCTQATDITQALNTDGQSIQGMPARSGPADATGNLGRYQHHHALTLGDKVKLNFQPVFICETVFFLTPGQMV